MMADENFFRKPGAQIGLIVLAAAGAMLLAGITSEGNTSNAVTARSTGPAGSQKKLLFTEHFHTLDTLKWRVEMEPLPASRVYAKYGKLVLDTRGGVTVWLKQPLRGNLQIDYTRKVLVAGSPNDRLSDLNQFWMASEPAGSELAKRSGKFEDYDRLPMYYVGLGGNANTTTRLRKYQRSGERVLLQEYSDAAHLLVPNHEYHLRTLVQNGTTSFWVDGQCYFSYHDPTPLPAGYFGFRSTYSRQEIADFRVYQLE